MRVAKATVAEVEPVDVDVRFVHEKAEAAFQRPPSAEAQGDWRRI